METENKGVDSMIHENLAEVEERVVQACKRAGRNRDDVTLIAKTLLEYETINEEEIDYLLKNREMPKETVKQRDTAMSMASDEMKKKISSDSIINEEKATIESTEEKKESSKEVKK